jgi:hypothetical protein
MSDIDPQEARDAAEEILSRPEFREESPTLVDRAMDWLMERISEILALAFGGDHGLWIGYLILGLGVVLALYFLVRHVRWGWLRKPESLSEVGIELIADRPLDRSQWLARAREAEAQGRWSRAVHARYRAMTAGLAAVDELSADDSATSGEHRNEFTRTAGSDPARVASFGGATDRFEHVWFGGRPAAETDAAAMAEADRVVLPSARPES